MASSKDYLYYVLDLLSDLEGITWKSMMGEYILYYQGKIFGGIYDDRFLIKPTKTASAMLPEGVLEIPYEGAKAMILVDAEDREFLKELVEAMYPELPAPRKRKR